MVPLVDWSLELLRAETKPWLNYIDNCSPGRPGKPASVKLAKLDHWRKNQDMGSNMETGIGVASGRVVYCHTPAVLLPCTVYDLRLPCINTTNHMRQRLDSRAEAPPKDEDAPPHR